MITDKYPNQYQNCYFSKYGEKAAILNGEKSYCMNGDLYDVVTGQKLDCGGKCDDWSNYRCKGINKKCGTPNPERPFTK